MSRRGNPGRLMRAVAGEILEIGRSGSNNSRNRGSRPAPAIEGPRVSFFSNMLRSHSCPSASPWSTSDVRRPLLPHLLPLFRKRSRGPLEKRWARFPNNAPARPALRPPNGRSRGPIRFSARRAHATASRGTPGLAVRTLRELTGSCVRPCRVRNQGRARASRFLAELHSCHQVLFVPPECETKDWLLIVRRNLAIVANGPHPGGLNPVRVKRWSPSRRHGVYITPNRPSRKAGASKWP